MMELNLNLPVQYATSFIGMKLSLILGLVAWAISAEISAWVYGNAGVFVERTVSALLRGKGFTLYMDCEWITVAVLDKDYKIDGGIF